jgi:lipopolysaccharide biosynthesis regulator YciM
MPLHVSSTSAHRQDVKIVLYSFWYHHTETSEWSKIIKISKITKIQFYKYEHVIVKFMCEFLGVIIVYYLLQTCYDM